MPLLALPNELLLIIASQLKNLGDINALTQVCRRCYEVINFHVYVRDIKDNEGNGLILAAQHGQLGAVRKFIDQGQDPFDYIDSDGGMPLNEAALYGRKDVVLFLLDYVPTTSDGNPENLHGAALSNAVRGGHDQVARIIIDSQAKPASLVDSGAKLVSLAVAKGRNSILALMLERGFKSSDYLLDSAVSQGSNDCVKVLLDWGFDVNFAEPNGCRSPLYAAAGKGHAATVRLLIDRGADPYRTSIYDFMPLFIATLIGHEDVVRILLDSGVNPEGLDEQARYPPKKPREEFLRVISGEYGTFSLRNPRRDILIYGSFPSLQTIVPYCSNCHTPLCVAAMMGHEDIVRLLLDRGVDPNFIDPNGDVPLRLAAMNNRSGVISLLLERGAWIDFVDLDGKTALCHALSNGSHEATIILLNAGAREDFARIGNDDLILQALNSAGVPVLPPTVLDNYQAGLRDNSSTSVAHGCYLGLPPGRGLYRRCERLVEFFLDRGSSIDSRDSLGRTVLHQASFLFCNSTIDLLLARGADPNACDVFGQTPLYLWLQGPNHYRPFKFRWHPS
ncbi:hypothetical protein N7448_006124 [Penicillium atrosanguineum]|uniref:Uncharacterized protein n=1 Tax=Penicillium atrosanguineum TaxID=1132637 RepID=A0A9W9PR30_9EURO|nr:Isocyanide synthase-NRPS hybrid crmA [Penicillium atrosanguineum]KAJ5131966.1 hypothetical protein N7448_006124 [Penicillium atrosanguineum]KAJ5137824.1 hypothetical protein N7526_004057 [Penicillium atrosanguineum]KAJ5289632.1 Isocyanide synthase-NRPS hybrid crmA [Penicillium atrosanguineum]KAJ5307451.1 hypothetical protein N7476_008107 [Penicillium atrosanguineum]